MLATLTRCLPQDFADPFVPAAAQATAGVAFLVLWAGMVWLARLLVPQSRTVASVTLAIIPMFALVPVAAVTLWLWLLTRTFIPWCAPANTSLFDAQNQLAKIAIMAGAAALILPVFVITGSGLAMGVTAFIRRRNM